MSVKTLSVVESVRQKLSELPDQKIVELMRWKTPLKFERMGDTYKKFVDKTETAQSLLLGYTIYDYLMDRVGEPK